MGKKVPFYLEYLKDEFEMRIEKNSQYSLRAFARWLTVDPSFLSKVFSRQKVLSLEVADKIVKKLAPEERDIRDKFVKSVSDELACHVLCKFDSALTSCKEDT